MSPRALPRLLLVACATTMCAPLASASTPPIPPTADHAYTEREHAFTVARPPAEAFGFFEPLGEKKWAEGWQPVFASPEDARLHDGSVFTVESAHPPGEPIHSIWTVSRYEPPRLIEYRNVLLGLRATRITVRCAPEGTGTRVTVGYVYHGLSARGDTLIARITPATYATMIESWGTDIAAYLRRGTPASP